MLHTQPTIPLPLHRLYARQNFDFIRDIWQNISQSERNKLIVHRRYSFPVSLPLDPPESAYWLDQEAGWSLTKSGVARKQADIIGMCARECGFEMSNSTITDATASIGGNVFAFAQCCARVNAIELKEPTAQMLLHNLELLHLSNKVHVWCGDSSDVNVVAQHMRQEVIFLDPPWEGVKYRQIRNLSLFLCEKNLRQVCIEWARWTRLIVLKLPLNFNSDEFFHQSHELPFVLMYSARIGLNRNETICAVEHNDRQSPPLSRAIMDIAVLRVKDK